LILAFFTGGASLIAEAANVVEKQAAFFKLLVQEIISTATMGLVDILRLFKILIAKFAQACKNGWAGFKRFIENLLGNKADDVLEEEGKVLDNAIGDGLYGGKVLSELEIEDWAIIIFKKYGTKLELVDDFGHPSILAQFDAVTNTIRHRKDVTKYLLFHETMHAEECFIIGKTKYLEDAQIVGTIQTNANAIRSYKREKYVYEKIKESSKKEGFNDQELFHNEIHFDIYVLELEKRKIKIPN
jgi:hypothetical protein